MYVLQKSVTPDDIQLKEIGAQVTNLDTCQGSYSLPTLSSRMFCAKSQDYGPCWVR